MARAVKATKRRVLAGELESSELQAECESANALIDDLLQRFVGSGVLDDRRFARSMISGQRMRGASSRLILQKLQLRGVDASECREVLEETFADAGESTTELEAAQAYVRRRRLGFLRKEPDRERYRDRDLAALARRGFPYGVANAALNAPASED